MQQSPDDQDPESVDFGFRRVPRSAKAGRVRAIFDNVAERYDLMNDLMSFGVHRWWKSVLIDRLDPRAGEHILDVAGGTGDIAVRIARRSGGRARVSVCDVNRAMVARGRDRAIDTGRLEGIDWLVGDAERLPFGDTRFDAYTIAFGIRNVTDIDRALVEARRVLKPGGRFVCLEFSAVALPGLEALYDAYSFQVLPRLGGIVTGDAEAYRYLVESIRRFPDQETFAARIGGAGFGRVGHRNLSGGIAALHVAWRI